MARASFINNRRLLLRRLSKPVYRLVVVTVIFVAVVVIGIGIYAYQFSTERLECINQREWLAEAEEAYFADHHRYLTGDTDNMRKLAYDYPSCVYPYPPECRQGGHYYADMDADGRLHIHCSIASHDKSGGVMLHSQMASVSHFTHIITMFTGDTQIK